MIADAGFEVEGAGTTTLPRHRADALGGGCGTQDATAGAGCGSHEDSGAGGCGSHDGGAGCGPCGGHGEREPVAVADSDAGQSVPAARTDANGAARTDLVAVRRPRRGNGSRTQCLSRTPLHSPCPPLRSRTPPTNCGRWTARTSGIRTVRCRVRQEPLIVESASGVRLRLAEPVESRRELVDGMSSWWSAVHGYNHPVLNEAARGQLDRMSHVMFGGLTHEPAVRLATRLVEITPGPLQHVFLADSGSVSVEVAVKMCLQYWRSAGRPAKRRLLTWRGGTTGTPGSRCRCATRRAGCTSCGRGPCPARSSPTPRRTASTRS